MRAPIDRPRMAQIARGAERDAINMAYVLGISLILAITLMSLVWIIPALQA